MSVQVYIYRWDRCGRKGQRCRVLARGTMNSCLLEFEDGGRMVTSRNALMKEPIMGEGLKRAFAATRATRKRSRLEVMQDSESAHIADLEAALRSLAERVVELEVQIDAARVALRRKMSKA